MQKCKNAKFIRNTLVFNEIRFHLYCNFCKNIPK